jgi:hypothetical protein
MPIDYGSNNVTTSGNVSISGLLTPSGINTSSLSTIGTVLNSDLVLLQRSDGGVVKSSIANAALQGVQGITGSQGTTGSQGVQGITGSQGTTGSQGVQGITGSQGTTGSQGVQGITGSQGTTGSQGVQGITGSQGTTGSQGVQGITGPVAGSANQVVYKNSSNVAAGSPNFTFTDSSNTLYLSGPVGVGIVAPSGGNSVHLKNIPSQWSSSNYGANLIIDGIRNNGIGILDGNSANPIGIVNNGGHLRIAHMPVIGNTSTPPTNRMTFFSDGGVGINMDTLSESNGKFGVANGASYVYACNDIYVTLSLGPRKQNDGYSTTLIYPTGVPGAGGQQYWVYNYSHSNMDIGYTTGGVNNSLLTIGTPAGGGGVSIGRQNSTDEGGELRWNKSSDNTPAWIMDVVGTGASPKIRLYDIAGLSERLTVLGNGNVGIGNANPGYKLDVVGSGNFSTVLEGGNRVKNKTLTYFTPLDNQPPASNFATLDTRNSIAVLDFDDTTEESSVFVGVIPENAALGSGISVRIHWMATSATSGNCRWGVQFEKMNTDLDSDSFDTATEAHSATNGTAGIVTTTTLTCTTIDSLAAGDLFRIKIYRDVTDTTNDTMTGDAELIAVELRSVL